MKANQLTCRPKWVWHGLAKGSGVDAGNWCATGDNRPQRVVQCFNARVIKRPFTVCSNLTPMIAEFRQDV
jgi:hypothetical protein